jgi:pathogenesis-related protein 1
MRQFAYHTLLWLRCLAWVVLIPVPTLAADLIGNVGKIDIGSRSITLVPQPLKPRKYIITLKPDVRFWRLPPGQTDLVKAAKDLAKAAEIKLEDISVGDRLLVKGKRKGDDILAAVIVDDGPTYAATHHSIVAKHQGKGIVSVVGLSVNFLEPGTPDHNFTVSCRDFKVDRHTSSTDPRHEYLGYEIGHVENSDWNGPSTLNGFFADKQKDREAADVAEQALKQPCAEALRKQAAFEAEERARQQKAAALEAEERARQQKAAALEAEERARQQKAAALEAEERARQQEAQAARLQKEFEEELARKRQESAEESARLEKRVAEEFAHEMLSLHNDLRAEAKLPPLQWSSMLAGYSQVWANTLLAKNLSLHNPDSPYGENIFFSGIGATPSMAIGQWASELVDYSYQTNTCRSDCGHYTQLVWRNTLKVGCAIARGDRREIWVCSYDPPGNYQGEWPY